MLAPVFLSYARNQSAADARQLKASLGEAVFLDSQDIEDGAIFPDTLIEALLHSRIVVVFLSETYFAREYCWREFRAAVSPLTIDPSPKREKDALRHIVIALPSSGLSLEGLPPSLRNQNWPAANDIRRLGSIVRDRLKEVPNTLG